MAPIVTGKGPYFGNWVPVSDDTYSLRLSTVVMLHDLAIDPCLYFFLIIFSRDTPLRFTIEYLGTHKIAQLGLGHMGGN
jgi:hypothetical protein